MPQYLLSVHHGDESPYTSDEEMQQAFADTGRVNAEMQSAGAWVFAGGLDKASTAKVVRSTDGVLLHTDGPYLDSKEHIGGFWVIDVADEAAALAWADKATVACRGSVEVRPFQG
jgi:hypothetical protein